MNLEGVIGPILKKWLDTYIREHSPKGLGSLYDWSPV